MLNNASLSVRGQLTPRISYNLVVEVVRAFVEIWKHYQAGVGTWGRR